MPVEGHHSEQCRRRCHLAGRRHGHDPSPDDAGYRRPGQGRSECSPFAVPAQRSGLLGDQGLVLCSAARPPGSSIAPADYLDPMSPIEEHLMSSSESSSTSAQDQYLDAVREGQEAWANVVRAWSDSVQRMWGEASSTTTREAPTAEQVIDNVFGFAEELLAAQRDFAKRLVQATAPAADAAQSTGKSTTKKATS
jgi:hypothetical protein